LFVPDVPSVHAQVTLAALQAGKHVHSEKPLAITREDGQHILETAKRKVWRVGCALTPPWGRAANLPRSN
jgi:predicted dehydrogenase